MLANLHVKNLALIEEADINFKDGLNILTGETGAGKSIILGSVNLALGGKAVSDLIRSGADYALTELSFDIESEAVKEKLTAFGVEELEEGQLIISRKITPTRSQIKVNGQTYTLGQVREMASWLIDIHGQHDNQLLLNESHHIDILDAYAKESLAEVKAALKEVYAAYVKHLIRTRKAETARFHLLNLKYPRLSRRSYPKVKIHSWKPIIRKCCTHRRLWKKWRLSSRISYRDRTMSVISWDRQCGH